MQYQQYNLYNIIHDLEVLDTLKTLKNQSKYHDPISSTICEFDVALVNEIVSIVGIRYSRTFIF